MGNGTLENWVKLKVVTVSRQNKRQVMNLPIVSACILIGYGRYDIRLGGGMDYVGVATFVSPMQDNVQVQIKNQHQNRNS